jgi:hypothetical protein
VTLRRRIKKPISPGSHKRNRMQTPKIKSNQDILLKGLLGLWTVVGLFPYLLLPVFAEALSVQTTYIELKLSCYEVDSGDVNALFSY